MAYLVGKKQDGQDLLLPGRVGPGERQATHRLAAVSGLGRGDRRSALSEAGPGEPDRTQHLAFGDLAAVWGVLERLGVVDIVDEVVGSRRSDAAGSVGTYIALAALNRVVAPCSKLAFADWWATTAGDRLVQLPPVAALDHRRFWDAMDCDHRSSS